MIRIISGSHKGRKLATPPDSDTTRPVPDRVRTAIFNMLRGHVEGESFFDAFAGVGSFGVEALSRGASRVVMVERDKHIARLLEENVRAVNAAERAEIVRSDALGAGALARCPSPVHIVFFDPPFPMLRDPDTRARVLDQFANCIDRLDETGFAILRVPEPFYDVVPTDNPDAPEKRPVRVTLPNAEGPESHVYGSSNVLWFMRRRDAQPPAPGPDSTEPDS